MNDPTPPAGLLGRLERFAQTDIRYLLSGGFWLGLSQVGSGLIAFGLSVAFAHFVSKDTYGTYRFLQSLFWTLTAFTLTGIPPALIRAIAKGEDGAYRSAVRSSILWSLPMGLIAFGMSGYYFFHANALLGLGLIVIGIFGPFMQGAYLFGSYLEGKQRFRDNAIAGLFLTLFPALTLLGGMFLFHSSLAFLTLYLGANVLTGFAISLAVYRKPAVRTALSKELSNLSLHFSAMNVLSTVSQQIDRLLVYHFLGAVDLAVYTFATAMPDQMKNIFNSVTIIALPRFVKRPLDEIRETLTYRLLGFTALAAAAAFAYIALAPFFFHLFFPTYAEAIRYSQLYALAFIPIGSMIPITALEAHAAKRELYIYNFFSPVFVIALLFFCISTYGLMGAIVARIIGRVGNLLFSLVLLRFARGNSPS